MVEDIVLESPKSSTNMLEPPEAEKRHVDYEYSVTPKFSAHQFTYRIFNGCYLEIEKFDKEHKPLASTSFHVGLLEAQPQKKRKTAWMTFLGALLTGLAAVGIAVKLGDYLLAGITGAMSLLLFAVYYFSYREVSLFFSRSGKAPLISLSHRCDCKKSLQRFVDQLERRIVSNTLPASSQFFAEETRWHRTLKDEGWISADEYEKARQKILKQFNRKSS